MADVEEGITLRGGPMCSVCKQYVTYDHLCQAAKDLGYYRLDKDGKVSEDQEVYG